MQNNNHKILIVDDDELKASLMVEQVRLLGYETISAGNGVEALERIMSDEPDLVLLDIVMPKMDGFQVLDKMHESPEMRSIPVIVISATGDLESVVKCIEKGAYDFLSMPFHFRIFEARIRNCLEKKRLRDREEDYRRQITEQNRTLENRVRHQVREISFAHLGMIFAMSRLTESREPETGAHLYRVREYCISLAKELAKLPKYSKVIDQSFLEDLFSAGPVHDIGKVGIPDAILLKKDKLTAEEYEQMKTHTKIGADALRSVNKQYPGNKFIKMGIEIAESHHERWDGAGYPEGLAGLDIPLAARILAVADVYDAVTMERCYKRACSHLEAREIILNERGRQFDPDLVDAFISIEDKILAIREYHQDDN